MVLTWENFKEAVLKCGQTSSFSARVSTIPGDDAVFITKSKEYSSPALQRLIGTSTTYRLTRSNYMKLARDEPEYIALLSKCRLSGFSTERGVRKVKEAVTPPLIAVVAVVGGFYVLGQVLSK